MNRHLTFKDRIIFENLIKDGVPPGCMGIIFGKIRDTFARELRRSNMDYSNYDAYKAQMLV